MAAHRTPHSCFDNSKSCVATFLRAMIRAPIDGLLPNQTDAQQRKRPCSVTVFFPSKTEKSSHTHTHTHTRCPLVLLPIEKHRFVLRKCFMHQKRFWESFYCYSNSLVSTCLLSRTTRRPLQATTVLQKQCARQPKISRNVALSTRRRGSSLW